MSQNDCDDYSKSTGYPTTEEHRDRTIAEVDNLMCITVQQQISDKVHILSTRSFEQEAASASVASQDELEFIHHLGELSDNGIRNHDDGVPASGFEFVIAPSQTDVVPEVIDGVIVKNKRCLVKMCGITLCDDFFSYTINPELYPSIVVLIIIVIVGSILSLGMVNPLSMLTGLTSQNPTMLASFSPTQDPSTYSSMYPSMRASLSPISDCISVFPSLNLSLIGDDNCDGGNYMDKACGYDGGDCVPSIELVGKAYAGSMKWPEMVLGPDGNLYSVPNTFQSILRFNPETGKSTLIGQNLGSMQWVTGVLGSDGMIYGVPLHGTSILKYDPVSNNITFVAKDHELLNGRFKFSGGIQAPNGKLYLIPFFYDKILIFDSSNIDDPLMVIKDNLGKDILKFRGAVLGPDGNIYCTPFNAKQVLKISVLDDTVSYIGDVLLGSDKWTNGAVAKNGNIYVCPYCASHVLKININNGTTSLVGSDLGHDTNKWTGFIKGPDGLFYGIPFDSNELLIFDPETETTTMLPLNDKLHGESKWGLGNLANNGVIYAPPFHSQSQILAIKPNMKRDTPANNSIIST